MAVWWFHRLGGMERHVVELACALVRRGIEVTVFSELPAESSNAYVRQLRGAGVKVIAPPRMLGLVDSVGKFEMGRAKHWIQRALGLYNSYRSTERERAILDNRGFHPLTAWMMKRMAKQAQANPPDVVHVHGIRLGQHWVVQWAAAHGYASVYTEHSTISDWGGPFDQAAPWVVSADADALAAVSGSARDSLLETLPCPRPVFIAHHLAPVPERHTALPGKRRVLCVARLARHKGIDLLLEAMAMLARDHVEAQLTIAGDGPERKNLERLASDLGIASRVDFRGHVDAEEVSRLWEQAAIGVLPSRTEGLPLSLLEGMAHGRPVVAAAVGGIPEVVVHEESGLLVEPENARALADAIGRLLGDGGLAARLGAKARQMLETGVWSEERVVTGTLDLYRHARERRNGLARSAVHQPSVEPAAVRRVFFVTWGLGPFGDMEEFITTQACALAQSGIEVQLFTVTRVPWTNRYRHRLRRAGVRLKHPRAGKRTQATVGEMIEAEHRRRPACALHLHGWRLGLLGLRSRPGLSRIPTVYTEHAQGDEWDGGAHSSPRSGSIVFSAATEPARAGLAEHVGGHIAVIRHAGKQSPPPAVSEPIVLSPAKPSFRIALTEAMAEAQPIVIAGPARNLPICHRANGLVAASAEPAHVNAAVEELRSDGLLASALGAAARRTFETTGYRGLAITNEAMTLYLRAQSLLK